MLSSSLCSSRFGQPDPDHSSGLSFPAVWQSCWVSQAVGSAEETAKTHDFAPPTHDGFAFIGLTQCQGNADCVVMSTAFGAYRNSSIYRYVLLAQFPSVSALLIEVLDEPKSDLQDDIIEGRWGARLCTTTTSVPTGGAWLMNNAGQSGPLPSVEWSSQGDEDQSLPDPLGVGELLRG